MRHSTVALLCLGHLVTDLSQGALPALLPFLIAEYGLTYAAAGVIVFATNIASSVVQPLFGHLADRHPSPWLAALGHRPGGGRPRCERLRPELCL